MWPKSAPTQPFKIGHSRWLNYWQAAWHLTAVIAVFITGFPDEVKWISLLLLMIHAAVTWKQNSQGHPILLTYNAIQGWQIEIAQATDKIIIQPTTFISNFVILLHYQTRQGKRKSLAIPRDAMQNNDFRTLYVMLKTTHSA